MLNVMRVSVCDPQCNCWEAVGVRDSSSNNCEYRLLGDFTKAHCASSAQVYGEYSAFWLR